MSRGIAKLLTVIVYIATIILVMAFARNTGAVVGIMLAFIVASFILRPFLRCPKCGRGQGRSWLFAEYCPYCGELLD